MCAKVVQCEAICQIDRILKRSFFIAYHAILTLWYFESNREIFIGVTIGYLFAGLCVTNGTGNSCASPGIKARRKAARKLTRDGENRFHSGLIFIYASVNFDSFERLNCAPCCYSNVSYVFCTLMSLRIFLTEIHCVVREFIWGTRKYCIFFKQVYLMLLSEITLIS